MEPFNQGLLTEIRGEIRWTIVRDEVAGSPEFPKSEWDIRLVPDFPLAAPELQSRTQICWDVLELIASCTKPGAYHLIDCTCGLGDHAGLCLPVFVAHPGPETVVWEMDARECAPALAAPWAKREGFVRWVFARGDYEAAVKAMAQDTRAANTAERPVSELLPNRTGLAWEEFCAIDLDRVFAERHPILPPGTVLELREDEWSTLNGQPFKEWLPRLFPRLAIYNAMMLSLPKIRPGMPDLPPSRSAGVAFVEIFRLGLAEGNTTPGVTIRQETV